MEWLYWSETHGQPGKGVAFPFLGQQRSISILVSATVGQSQIRISIVRQRFSCFVMSLAVAFPNQRCRVQVANTEKELKSYDSAFIPEAEDASKEKNPEISLSWPQPSVLQSTKLQRQYYHRDLWLALLIESTLGFHSSGSALTIHKLAAILL